MPVALGIDPGLAHVGLALVEQENAASGPCIDYRVLRVGYLKTTKGPGPVTGDDLRRYREILESIGPWLASAYCVGIEAFSSSGARRKDGSRHRTSAAGSKTGVAYGLILARVWEHTDIIHVMHPNQTRARLGLVGGATKEAVHAMAFSIIGKTARDAIDATPRGQREHVGDAIALALCALMQEGRP
jgi:Holliday junction resolvasome RuvABC endonuclease subunit